MMQPRLFGEARGSAHFSACARYRYVLEREVGPGSSRCLFIMLNPSTADAETDDPTVRKCMGYARRWGYDRLVVCNLFGWRATNPKALRDVEDPVGPVNDFHLFQEAYHAQAVVAAWGNDGALRDRGRTVLECLNNKMVVVKALAMTKAGHPQHPLYLPYSIAQPLEAIR